MLRIVAFAGVLIGLLVRIVHRGPYFPGWDVVGAANGLYLVSTHSFPELVAFYRLRVFDGALAWNVISVLTALMPGFLASVWPSEYWPLVVTPAIVGTVWLILARALDERPRYWPIALAWGASPALLSYTVAGFAYISNTLPFAIALYVVLRLRDRPGWTAVLGLTSIVAAWQVQELGRTVFVVYLAASLAVWPARRHVRALWVVLGLWQLYLANAHHSFNTMHYAEMALPGPLALPGAVLATLRHLLTAQADLPILLVAGLVSLACLPRLRAFWLLLFLFQLGLLVLLAANSGTLEGVGAIWPRRALLLSFVCVATCASVCLARARGWAIVAALLVLGNAWQAFDTARWAAKPLDFAEKAFTLTLPYTQSPLPNRQQLDGRVPLLVVDAYQEMRSRLDAGKRVFLAYNLSSFDENATDPAGALDRLYLHLGHERFLRDVFVFGSGRIRCNELPIRPMAELGPALDAIQKPEQIEGFWLFHPNDDNDWPNSKHHREEFEEMFAQVYRRFDVWWGIPVADQAGRILHRFRLRAKPGA